MRTVKRAVVVLGVVAVFATAADTPAAATGSVTSAILTECHTGQLPGTYTVNQLQQALAVMPGSDKQYSSCPDVVQTAIFQAQHHHGSGIASGSAGAFLPTPAVVVLALLVVAAVGFMLLAIRRTSSAGHDPLPPGTPPGPDANDAPDASRQ